MGSVHLQHHWRSASERAGVRVLRDALGRAGLEWAATPRSANVAMVKMSAQGVWAGVRGAGPRPIDLGCYLRPEDIEARVFPPFLAVIAPSQLSLFGVPIGAFRSNCVWVHAPTANRLGAQPADVAEWVDWLERARAHVRYPLGVSREPWAACLLFEALVLGLCGADVHRQAFAMGVAEALAAPCMRNALVVLGKLRQFVADDCVAPSWHALARDLQSGRCATVVMGDWLRNEFADANRGIPSVAKWTMPGTEGRYLYNVDYLTPIVAAHQPLDREALAVVARALLDAEVQGRFGRAKGALPTVRDAIGPPLDGEGWRLLHLSALNPDLLVPSMSFEQAAPRGRRDAIAHAVQRYLHGRAGFDETARALVQSGRIE